MLASIAQKRARLDFNERKEKANGPVPLFVLVIAPIPVLSAPLCVSGPNVELTWPSMMLTRQTNREAVLISLPSEITNHLAASPFVCSFRFPLLQGRGFKKGRGSHQIGDN